MTASRSLAVLGVTIGSAFLGVFPYHLLFLVPLAASLTLPGLGRRVRLVVAAVSLAAIFLGVASLFGIT